MNILKDDDLRIKRISLLPLWIKIFIYIVLFSGILTLLLVVCALVGCDLISTTMSLYGLSSSIPFDPIWTLVCFLFLFKSFTAILMLTQKKLAIDFALADAIIGIAIIIYYTLEKVLFGYQEAIFDVRLEIFLLLPYMYVMLRIRNQWRAITGI